MQTLLQPIEAQAAGAGFTHAYEATTDADGDKVYLWPGTVTDRPVAASALSTVVAVIEPTEDLDVPKVRGRQLGPGLLVRRRKSV